MIKRRMRIKIISENKDENDQNENEDKNNQGENKDENDQNENEDKNNQVRIRMRKIKKIIQTLETLLIIHLIKKKMILKNLKLIKY